MRRNRSGAEAKLVSPGPREGDEPGVTGQSRAEQERDLRLRELGHDLRTPLTAISMGIPIELECWDEAPGEWDRDRLLQLTRNLLSNALGHGAADEPVVVSVIDCREDALLSVFNRGQPIPDPLRQHLFDPAWSGDRLGLYIVEEIVRAHGGRIELTSDDSATVFHVWLPKTRGSGAPRDTAKEERS
jgi:sigma-B regulation protein RsbU (phosphoserine phosphatase)